MYSLFGFITINVAKKALAFHLSLYIENTINVYMCHESLIEASGVKIIVFSLGALFVLVLVTFD